MVQPEAAANGAPSEQAVLPDFMDQERFPTAASYLGHLITEEPVSYYSLASLGRDHTYGRLVTLSTDPSETSRVFDDGGVVTTVTGKWQPNSPGETYTRQSTRVLFQGVVFETEPKVIR